MAKITIFGMAGTGTSSTGKTLAEKLGYKFISNGDFARQKAKELGLSIYELDELSKSDSEYDLMRDKMVADFGKANDNFVAEGRLSWYFIPDSFKVKLHCDFEERVKRVAIRDDMSVEDTKKYTLQRELAIAERFLKYYDITDAQADSNFDLIIDTTSTPLPEVVEKICRHFNLK